MAIAIPKTSDLAAQNLANYEAEVGQTSPLNDKAFLRVQAGTDAMNSAALYRYGAERALQNLALTATDEGLDEIGSNYGALRTQAQATVLTTEMMATDGTTIYTTNAFIGQLNGERYFPDANVTAAGGTGIDLTLVAENPGEGGNLNIDDLVTIEVFVPGVAGFATVTSVVSLGIETEEDEDYRPRVLDEIRTVGGGGNGVDYRTWAQQAPGVRRAYPYAGRPATTGTALPGERTVYIEAETSLDEDGLASQPLLDSAREYIDTNQATGQQQTPLGSPNSDADTLWVESIYRTGIIVEIRTLVIDPLKEAQAKAEISDGLDEYLRGITMFVDGVDPPATRSDTVSALTISTTVQNVLSKYGATASSIGFGIVVGTFLSEYSLSQGELAKLLLVSYA